MEDKPVTTPKSADGGGSLVHLGAATILKDMSAPWQSIAIQIVNKIIRNCNDGWLDGW